MNEGVVIIEGHAQGLSNMRSFGERDIPVFLLDTHACIAQSSRYCLKFLLCPSYNSEDFITFLMDIGKEFELYGWLLFPSNDHVVYNLSKNKSKLSDIYKVAVPGMPVIENIFNKEKLIRTAQMIGHAVPLSFFPEDYDHINKYRIVYPSIIKGKFGLDFYKKTGKKAYYLQSDAELNSCLRSLSGQLDANKIMIQNVIPEGDQKTVSVAVFVDKGNIMASWVGEKLREHPLKFGTATYCRSIHQEELIEIARELVKELNYSGVCEIEYLFDPRDKKYKLIELNARTWLWVELAKECGINFALGLYYYHQGKHFEFPSAYEKNKFWINYLTDIPFGIFGLVKGHYKITSLIRSWLGRNIKAVFHKDDLRPAFFSLLLLPYTVVKRFFLR